MMISNTICTNMPIIGIIDTAYGKKPNNIKQVYIISIINPIGKSDTPGFYGAVGYHPMPGYSSYAVCNRDREAPRGRGVGGCR